MHWPKRVNRRNKYALVMLRFIYLRSGSMLGVLATYITWCLYTIYTDKSKHNNTFLQIKI